MSKAKRPKIQPATIVRIPDPVEPSGIKWGQLLAALVTAIAAFVGGQVTPNVLPVITVDPAPVVAVAPPEAWIPTDGSGKRIECVALESLASTLTDGAYTLTGVPKAGEPWQTRSVVLSTAGVVPPKPVPVPTPTPTPPGPAPQPDEVATVKLPGFRAMMLYESTKGMPLVFADKSVRDYLNAKCVKGDDGKTPDWRQWDADLDPEGDFDEIVMYRKATDPKSLPWIHCGNGSTAYNGPAPATAAELLDILKKHGGS